MPASGPVTIDTPLGPDTLVFSAMRGAERLGQPFEYTVDLVSDDPNVKLANLLGQTMTVNLDVGDGELRRFNGYVTAVDCLEGARPKAAYRATLRPWIWLLGHSTDCRIFQNMTVPDIVKQVFRDHGFSDFEEALSADYAKADYVVQYRESALHFVSRLLEHAGIYYFFRHSATAHTLVLADSYGAHKRTPGCERLAYYPPDEHRLRFEEHVDRWRLTQRMTSGAVSLRDFDFERPNAELSTKVSSPKDYAKSDFEAYDYPGDYRVRGDGEALARVRLEERQKNDEQVGGHTNARRFASGALFELAEYARDDQNKEYLIVATDIAVVGHQLQSGASADSPTFSCDFEAIDSRVQFRTSKITRKPVVEGPQTAVVVGKAGEEIWTDKYARVKVQFHWDRIGERDEKSSCWVRVSQAWAGSNWGFIQIPRIGQEVIVDFLEGDPDRPIITGRVYNGNNMPPYALPANQTQSGAKSRSSKGGSAANANEIRFEDRKGQEEMHVQAEKDLSSVVKHSETRSVGADRTTSIGQNETLTVGKNRKATVAIDETIVVGANETRRVGGNETIEVTGNETMTVGGNQSVTVTGDDATRVSGSQSLTIVGTRTEEVLVAETILVGGAQSITAGTQAVTVGARTKSVLTSESSSVGGNLTETVGGAVKLSITGGRATTVGGDDSSNVSGGLSLKVGKKGELNVGQQLIINAADELVLSAGDASITLKKNGDIVIKGKNVSSDASGKVSLKASSDVVLKGSKISHN